MILRPVLHGYDPCYTAMVSGKNIFHMSKEYMSTPIGCPTTQNTDQNIIFPKKGLSNLLSMPDKEKGGGGEGVKNGKNTDLWVMFGG